MVRLRSSSAIRSSTLGWSTTRSSPTTTMTGRLPKGSSAAGSASESASCGPERLLFVVAGGEVTWDEATQRFDPDRSDAALPVLTQPGVLPTEPLYVDVTGDAPWHPAAPLFREKVTDLAAPIHGKPKDELAGEDRREQRRFRRLRRIAIVSLVCSPSSPSLRERSRGYSGKKLCGNATRRSRWRWRRHQATSANQSRTLTRSRG